MEKMTDADSALSTEWDIVIFFVEGKANHVGLSIPGHGLADLSLLGARVIPWAGPSLPKGERLYFPVTLRSPTAALKYLQQPGLLTIEILKKEKAFRGWHMTPEAPDFVRVLRDERSVNVDDMNCVEWIAYALELGGVRVPMNVMTPSDLCDWCEHNGQ